MLVLNLKKVSHLCSASHLDEVVALLPVLGGLDSVAWGVVDGLGTTLDSALRGVVCAVDGTTDGLGGTEGLATEPLGVSDDAVGSSLGLLCAFTSSSSCSSLINLSEFHLPVVGERLSKSEALLLREHTFLNLSVEVVTEVVSLGDGVCSGGGGGESGVESEAHCVIDQVSFYYSPEARSLIIKQPRSESEAN